MDQARNGAARAGKSARAYWLKTLHQWHWISAAISLAALLLFGITGVTLNHAAQIQARPQVMSRQLQLPPPLLAQLAPVAPDSSAPLPEGVSRWIRSEIGVDVRGHAAQWSDGEAYVSLPRPGGDAWLSIDTGSGRLEYERTDRGWIAWLNDLHKGRNTGSLWSWFIDLFALACVVFALTGLGLLWLHGRHRPMTWPLVILGLVLPALIAIVFIH